MKSFKNYCENRSIQQKIELAAIYVAASGFPIKEFCNWYLNEGLLLNVDEYNILMEGFWGDTWKGVKRGAGYGAIGGLAGGPAGSAVGGLAGAAMGGLAGAGSNLWKRFKKWYDPIEFNNKEFNKRKKEALEALNDLKNISTEINSTYKGTAPSNINNTIFDPNFNNLLDNMINNLSAFHVPKLTTTPQQPSNAPNAPQQPSNASNAPQQPSNAPNAPQQPSNAPQQPSNAPQQPSNAPKDYKQALVDLENQLINGTIPAAGGVSLPAGIIKVAMQRAVNNIKTANPNATDQEIYEKIEDLVNQGTLLSTP